LLEFRLQLRIRLRLNLNFSRSFRNSSQSLNLEGSVSQILPMQYLTPGETGCVLEVEGEKNMVRRLGEMGLRVGVEVRMVQPGKPCIVALDHQRLSFRGEDDAVVLVEVDRI
jgi:ferrous iron transport protein A